MFCIFASDLKSSVSLKSLNSVFVSCELHDHQYFPCHCHHPILVQYSLYSLIILEWQLDFFFENELLWACLSSLIWRNCNFCFFLALSIEALANTVNTSWSWCIFSLSAQFKIFLLFWLHLLKLSNSIHSYTWLESHGHFFRVIANLWADVGAFGIAKVGLSYFISAFHSAIGNNLHASC